MCGKSTRMDKVIYLSGKPHPEQDKVSKLYVSCSLTLAGMSLR